MRSTLGIVALALIICLGPVDAGTPQPTAVMTISGMPGQIAVHVDQTDWSQIQGMPDPRTSLATGTSSLLSSRPGSPLTSRGGTSGARSGRVEMQDVSITKDIDQASPKLMLECTSGTHIREVTLEIRPAGGDSREYLIIEMTNLVITSVTPQSTTGTRRPTESVTFSPHISPRRVARPARCREMWRFRPEGRGGVLDSTSSTPRRENAADCGISRAVVARW